LPSHRSRGAALGKVEGSDQVQERVRADGPNSVDKQRERHFPVTEGHPQTRFDKTSLRARCVRPLQMIHNDCHAELSSGRRALRSLPSIRCLRKSAAHRYRRRWSWESHFRRRHGALHRRHRRERERRCLRNLRGWRLNQRRIWRRWRIVPERRLGWSTFVRRHCLWSTAGYLQKGHPRGGRLLPHLHGHGV